MTIILFSKHCFIKFWVRSTRDEQNIEPRSLKLDQWCQRTIASLVCGNLLPSEQYVQLKYRQKYPILFTIVNILRLLWHWQATNQTYYLLTHNSFQYCQFVNNVLNFITFFIRTCVCIIISFFSSLIVNEYIKTLKNKSAYLLK